MVSKNENLDWEGYEAITKYIYETLGSKYGIKIKCRGRNCKVMGKSGVSYQIDVLTEQWSEGKVPQLTAIECKCLNKKNHRGNGNELHSKMQDSRIQSGIIDSFFSNPINYLTRINTILVLRD